MSRWIQHRGPDDQGFLSYRKGENPQLTRDAKSLKPGSVLLSHKRLSILDLSPAGWQPMIEPSGRYALTFNGEVYNYKELRVELETRGHVFKSQSDTEVVLLSLKEWGPAALSKYIGMFALALFDTQEQTLLLARDPWGIKPLYYSFDFEAPETFAFASEMKAFLKSKEKTHKLVPELLGQYLRFGINDASFGTMVQGIDQLPPAHYLILNTQTLKHTLHSFWQLKRSSIEISEKEAIAGVRDRFLESIRLHLRSDVPIGSALSGGLDSSCIVGAMRYLMGPSLQLHTFSYVSDDPKISESKWLKIIEDHVLPIAKHTETQLADFLQDWEDFLTTQDQPVPTTSMYLQWHIFKEAKQAGIKVLLDGQGADEVFGGYIIHSVGYIVELLRMGKWLQARNFVSAAAPRWGVSAEHLWSLALKNFLPDWGQKFARGLTSRPLMSPWLNESWFQSQGLWLEDVTALGSKGSLFSSLQLSQQITSLPQLLRFEDRNSMAHSIESRVPYLNTQLVDYVANLPAKYFFNSDGATKNLLREAMRGIVPNEILDRRNKISFEPPQVEWIKELKKRHPQLLTKAKIEKFPCLNAPVLMKYWDQLDQVADAKISNAIWKSVNLMEWCRIFAIEIS